MSEDTSITEKPETVKPLPEPLAKAARLINEIFKRRAEKLAPKPPHRPNSVYASNIPHCERQGVYEFTNYQDKIGYTWELKALFQAGNVNEDAYKSQLRDLGFKLLQDGAPLSDDMRIKYNIGGYLDWRVEWEGAKIPFEAKLMSPMIFDKIIGFGGELLKSGEITADMIARSVESMKRFPWTAKYLRQLTVYLLGTHEEAGIFALTDGRGTWKFVIVPLDYELAEAALKTAESINKHVAAGTLPERIPFSTEHCGRCPFANVCIPDIKRDAKLKIEDNPELDAMLAVREAHLESWQKVEKIDRAIKKFFEDVKDGVFMVGHFLITRTSGKRVEYNIPDDVKEKYKGVKTIYRSKFERVSKPSAEDIYLEPRRLLGFLDDEAS